jgi:tRNA1(Val) A37 N6-methylase TrmN6
VVRIVERAYFRKKILANGQLLGKLKKYVNRNSTVLDIGAGTGYLTLALAPRQENMM